MSKLNKRNNKTKGIIHLLVTPLCDRNCKFCCNKQYDLKKVPFITNEELSEAHTLLLTGGEPFKYSNPIMIADYYKQNYPNIKNIYVYSNVSALHTFLFYNHIQPNTIDGLSLSIKDEYDYTLFKFLVRFGEIASLSSNRLYVFDKTLIPDDLGNFQLIMREWQEDFKPAEDSIFRRL